MMRIVDDSSVAIKWLLPGKHDERDWENALRLLEGVRSEQIRLAEPPHWLAEVAAVVTRLSPATALEDVSDLYAMDIPIVRSVHVYSTACKLSRELDHHLFDRLYYAVALSLDDADPDETHKHRMVDLLKKVNAELIPLRCKLCSYDIHAIDAAHGTFGRLEFCYKSKFSPRKYTDDFVIWLIEQMKRDKTLSMLARSKWRRQKRAMRRLSSS